MTMSDTTGEEKIVEQYGIPCINLECIPDEDLALLGDTFDALASFCGKIRMARGCRRNGLISSAIEFEAQAECIFKRLPASLKW
jgi:hypothetical protein